MCPHACTYLDNAVAVDGYSLGDAVALLDLQKELVEDVGTLHLEWCNTMWIEGLGSPCGAEAFDFEVENNNEG